MDGTPVATSGDTRILVGAGAGHTVRFEVQRDTQVIDLFAGLGRTEEGGRTIGVLGIRGTPLTHMRLSSASFTGSFNCDRRPTG